MTILPKKKTTKDKNDAEPTEHAKTHHPTPAETRHEKVNRARTSPTRWLPTTPREETQPVLDPGGSFEPLDSTSSHNVNKRRHRSSPHRSGRKHRGHCSASVTGQGGSTSADNQEQVEEEGYNSEDEYTAPSYPDNIEEVIHLFVNVTTYL